MYYYWFDASGAIVWTTSNDAVATVTAIVVAKNGDGEVVGTNDVCDI